MSTSVTLNGTSYTIPALADASWGTNVSNYLIAIAAGCLQKSGGTFTLTAEVNFGATYGIKAACFKSQGTVIAAAGVLRLAKTETVSWKNTAGSGDLPLGIDSSDRLTFNSLPISALALGAADTVLRVNSAGTATEYAKLTTANISATAAIVDTQLATIATSGKVSNSATTAASANTASAIVARDGSGNFSAGTITAALTGNVTGNVSGTAGTVTTNANLTGPVTSVGNATAIADGALALAKLATTTAGFVPVGAVTTGVPTYVAISGDATLSSTGVVTLAVVGPAKGGTGVANNAACTTTRSGSFAKTETLTNTTSVTYPTAGTLATLAGVESLTGKSFVTAAVWLANGEARFNNSGNTFYTGFKGGEAAANKIWTLPLVDGSSGQVLGSDGAATLGWYSVVTNPMTAVGDLIVGGASGAATRLASTLLGDIKVIAPVSAAYTVTSASPGVFTVTTHGMTTGDKAYVTVTQNGFTANTTYYVNSTGANTFTLCTTLANAKAGTGITSSGTVAGTIVSGGLALTSGVKGTLTNDAATAGYVGEYIEAKTTGGTNTAASATYFDAQSITLTAGDWDVSGVILFSRNGATFTALEFVCGISGTTGNSATGLVNPVTSIDDNYAGANLTFGNFTLFTPLVRVQSDGTNLYINGATISSSQVVYLKGFSSTFTVGTSQYISFLRARRIR